MTPERHARTKELFLAACRLAPEARSSFLDQACGDDADLRAQVADLLAHSSGEAPRAAASGDDTQPAAVPSSPAEANRPPPAPPHRFETGASVAGRYRIVALLGRGGMGEVYRADDLTLGQTVALKFLSPAAAHDPSWLTRFLGEVRIAREVTHPNVCRVYDIGQADGEHYLSMEYIDGENLKTLLSRIGRVPRDKALQIARQLCSGLAAAHAKGVLHRDLKPANVMLDGRGQVRITDFGLAGLREDIHGLEVMAGTPAYMAPEQLAGRDVTVRSDIYSLGLVLYELFTGRPAFEAQSFIEYRRIKEDSNPTPPSDFVADIEPAVERIILRCLAHDPHERPPTALAVMVALPGGDPLMAALAAGETPSPEMVAAAGTTTRLRLPIAIAGLAAFLVLLSLAILSTPLSFPLWDTPGAKSAQVLAEKARDVDRDLPSDEVMADEAFGWQERPHFVSAVLDVSPPAQREFAYALPGTAELVFWYRASPTPLVPTDPFNVLFGGARVTLDDPAATDAGRVDVILDPLGRLLGFEVEARLFEPTSRPAQPVDWSPFLQRAGLDPARLTACAPATIPHVMADSRRAWYGTLADDAALPVRVEAAEHEGCPVSLAVLKNTPDADDPVAFANLTRRNTIITATWQTLLAVLIAVSVPLTRHNLQRGRSDRRGAFRLAVFVYFVCMTAWVLQAQHATELGTEVRLLALALSGALVEAALVWLFYTALEPYARHYWPQLLIVWSRLLSGQLRDPLLGSHILLGAIMGAYFAVIERIEGPLTAWLGLHSYGALHAEEFLGSLLSARYALATGLDAARMAVYQGLCFLLLLVLLRALLRRTWAAAIVATLLIAPLLVPRGSHPAVAWPLFGLAGTGVLVWSLTRFGPVPVVTALFTALVLVRAPLTLDLRAWYADLSILALVLVLAVAIYGFVTARTGAESVEPSTG